MGHVARRAEHIGRSAGFAVGSRFVVIGWDPLAKTATSVAVASFDPATHSWSRLPDLTLPSGNEQPHVQGTAVGDTLFVWVDAVTGAGSSIGGAYALQDDHWVQSPFTYPRGEWSVSPLWTGTSMILPGLSSDCRGCTGPAGPMNSRSLDIDASTGQRLFSASGPDGALGPWVWTGKALFGVGYAGMFTNGNGVNTARSGAWDPNTKHWTTLPAVQAFGSADQPCAFWTGDRVLFWDGGLAEFVP